MNKEELLAKINEYLIIEEQAIPVYSEHLKTIFRWSSLKNEDRIKNTYHNECHYFRIQKA